MGCRQTRLKGAIGADVGYAMGNAVAQCRRLATSSKSGSVYMSTSIRLQYRVSRLTAAMAAGLLLGSLSASAGDVKVSLTGAEETPPVTSAATGTGTLHVNADKSVSGSIKTQGITGIAAHIHTGARGESGPPIITLTQGPDGTWSVPAGSKLTDEQFANFKSGKLYVNVHSAEHKPGEIRAQLQP